MSCPDMVTDLTNKLVKPTVHLCVEHLLEHHTRLQEHLDHVIHKESSLSYKLRLLILQLPKDITPDLIGKIDEFKMQLEEMEATVGVLQDEINEDDENRRTKTSEDLANDIECLRKDTKALKSKLNEIYHYSQKRTLLEQLSKETPSSSFSDASQSSLSDLELHHNTMTSSNQSLDRVSPLMSERNGSDSDLALCDPSMPSKFTQKIHLSNNVVRWLRGPVKVIFNGTMHVFDVCAQGTRISSAALQAVPHGLLEQQQTITGQLTNEPALKPAFADITSEWVYEGVNLDRGFNSESIWMRDPQGRRILAKTQGHPLCAANEWLVYTLGTVLGLPVNEVQIGVYQNNLVTLHTDVSRANERTITFMELPRQARKRLMTDPIVGCMDFLDQIIQNADRNQRNILITMPNATDMRDPAAKMNIHLIDHASCFGMGKLSIISLIACKFHSNHLTVVKFDPAEQASKFELYLSSLPVVDRLLIRRTLSRFAAITDDRFGGWLNEVKGLLSGSQYTRIRSVLHQQRDIAKEYLSRWSVCTNDFSVKSNHTHQIISENKEPMTYF